MLIRRVPCTLLIAGIIATSATVTQAQSPSRKPWPRVPAVGAPVAVVPYQPAVSVPVPEKQISSASMKAKKAIVGSWLGMSGEGNRLLVSFTSDGIVSSNVQTEVSTIPELGVLSPGHGVWTHVGGRQFEYTVVGILYTIDTGEYMGYLKARGTLTLDASGNQMTGTDRVEIFGPDGSLVFAVPPGPTQFMRIEAEPFE